MIIDRRIRVVSIKRLSDMCKQLSDKKNVYWIDVVSRSRVHVGYRIDGDPNGQVVLVFPCYPNDGNTSVVLDLMRTIGSPRLMREPYRKLLTCPTIDNEETFNTP